MRLVSIGVTEIVVVAELVSDMILTMKIVRFGSNVL